MSHQEQSMNVISLHTEQKSEVLLRTVGLDDLSEVRRLNLHALDSDACAFGAKVAERSHWTDQEWADFINEGHLTLGFNRTGKGVAMAGVRPKEGGIWQLHSVFVDPEYRKKTDPEGRRLSEQLITELIDTLRDRGATQIDLIVNQEKIPAVRLYERLGFRVVEELTNQPSADGLPHDKFVMSLELLPKEENLPLAA